MTEQERLELQLQQDARLMVEAMSNLSKNIAAYSAKFGPATPETRTDKITYSGIHIKHFLDNDGQAAAGNHWQNLLAGMYVV